MRVAIYDKNPGPGFNQWFLRLTWLVGCFLHKLFGKLDAYYAASSWADAIEWLQKQQKPLLSIQFWGHGSPGHVWNGGKSLLRESFDVLKPQLIPESVIWFRTCSTFQGQRGYDFSQYLADTLNCTIAGHTRIIGVFQGGLHTRKPSTAPSWPLTEVEFPPGHLASNGLKWGNNTIVCLRASIPSGW